MGRQREYYRFQAGSDPAGSTLDHLRLRISIDRGHQIFGANNERMRTKKSLRISRAREGMLLTPEPNVKKYNLKKTQVQSMNPQWPSFTCL